jgi:hypothetical protein
MSKSCKYILNSFNSPNYIPVKNMRDFNIDVLIYYNQYYASEKTTQNRRIMRNYLNNLESTKKANQNPFMNKQGKKFYFFYSYIQNYMVIENTDNNSIDVYIYINKCWCHMKHFSNKNNCKELEELMKSVQKKPYFV